MRQLTEDEQELLWAAHNEQLTHDGARELADLVTELVGEPSLPVSREARAMCQIRDVSRAWDQRQLDTDTALSVIGYIGRLSRDLQAQDTP